MDEGLGLEFEGLDETVREVIEAVGFCPPPKSDARSIYSLLTRGKCMACQGPLAEESVILVHKRGIVAGYCSGPCVQDIAVLGWLQEQYQDLVDSINFRGGRGDAPE